MLAFYCRFHEPATAIAIAIVLRVVIALAVASTRGESAFLAPDSHTYLTPAASLASTFTFEGARGAELFRTPGYPLLLVPGTLLGHPVAFAIGAQVLLSALLVALTFAIGGRIPALIVAVEPTLLLWSLRVMPETLLTLCLVAFAAAALRALETRRTSWTIAAAAALAAAAYVKPIAYPLLLLAALFLLFRLGVRHAAAFLLAAALLVAPWHVRNARHGYLGFSTLVDHVVYVGAGGSVLARQQQTSYATTRLELLKGIPEKPLATRYPSMRRDGLRLVLSDPLGYASTHVQGMVRTLFDPGAVEYLRMVGRYPELGGGLARLVDRGMVRGAIELARAQPLAVWSSTVFALLLLPLVVLPFVAATRMDARQRPAFLLFAIIAAWLVVAAGGVAGSSRFRAPAVPFLALMSAFAFRRGARLGADDIFDGHRAADRRRDDRDGVRRVAVFRA